MGVVGGYVFNVILQDGTPGSYLASFTALAQLPDLWQGMAKALVFGLIAAIVAAYKGMTISSCLEETLLHTWEPLGDGVASPHTKADLRKIQQMKQEHGIDYDSHGSYRFVERAR